MARPSMWAAAGGSSIPAGAVVSPGSCSNPRRHSKMAAGATERGSTGHASSEQPGSEAEVASGRLR